jgi:hypothetical protein
LVVSAPLDVIKTRIQNKNFENPEGGFKIIGKMMKNEGPTAFFKGLTPKLLMTGPKLVFSFWLGEFLSLFCLYVNLALTTTDSPNVNSCV